MARDANVRVVLSANDQATGPIRNFQNALHGVQGEMSGANQMAGMLMGGIAGMAASMGIDAIVSLGGAIADLGRQGEQMSILRDAFEQTASSVGASSTSMLSDLRSASGGMIADQDLILAANRAMMLGVADSSEKMSQLLEVAAVRGRAMGLSTAQAFNDLVTGLGRMSPLILDNLGIVTGGEAVFKQYAASIGKTADALTDAERKQALFNKVVASTDTSATPVVSQFERMDAAIQNAKGALGELFSPAVAAIAQQIADATTKATTAAQEGAAKEALDARQRAYESLVAQLDAAKAKLEQYNHVASETDDLTAKMLANVGTYSAPSSGQDAKKIEAEIAALEKEIAAYKNSAIHLNNVGASMDALDPKMDRLREKQAAAAQHAQFLATAEELVASSAGIMQGALDRAGGAVDSIRGKMIAATAAGMDMRAVMAGLDIAERIEGQAAKIREGLGNLGFYEPEDIEFAIDVNTARAQQRVDDLLGGFNEVENTIKSITSLTPGLLNNMSFDAALQWQAEQEASLRAQAESLRDQGYTNEQIAQYLRASVMETQAWAGGLDKVAKATNDIGLNLGGIDTTLSSLQGKVAAAVQAATSLDPVGVNPDDYLPREDAVQENAFRLAAIMKEGLIDQPWLEEFKNEVPGVFEELIASGDIKGKAAEILQQFQMGLRPELLDLGKLKEGIKQDLAGEAALQATAVKVTAELVTETGGDQADIQKRVNEALGLGGSDLTGNIIADLTGGDFTGQLNTAGAAAGQNWNNSFAAQITPPTITPETAPVTAPLPVDIVAGPLDIPQPGAVLVPLLAGPLNITQPPPVEVAVIPDFATFTGVAMPDLPGVAVAVIPDTGAFTGLVLPQLPMQVVPVMPDTSAFAGLVLPEPPAISVAVTADTTPLANAALPDLPGVSVAVLPDLAAWAGLTVPAPPPVPVTLVPGLLSIPPALVPVIYATEPLQVEPPPPVTVPVDAGPLTIPAPGAVFIPLTAGPLEVEQPAAITVPLLAGLLDIPQPAPVTVELAAGPLTIAQPGPVNVELRAAPLQITQPPPMPVEVFAQPLEIASLPAMTIETRVEPLNIPPVPPVNVQLQWLISPPELPTIEAPTVDVNWSVSLPQLPALEAQTVNVGWNVAAPELPTVGDQVVRVDWIIPPPELDVAPVTVELNAGPLAITQPPPMVVDVDVNPVDVAGKIAAALGLGVKNAQLTDGILGELNSATFTARLEGSANRNGQQWGNTFLTTVQNNVPAQLIGLLTDLVTPGVVARLQQQDSLTGPME